MKEKDMTTKTEDPTKLKVAEEPEEGDDEPELTRKEKRIVEEVLETFDTGTSDFRRAAFEALHATFCHECGEPQPEDPEEDCPCLPDEDDEEDEDEDEEDEDQDDEGDDDGASN